MNSKIGLNQIMAANARGLPAVALSTSNFTRDER